MHIANFVETEDDATAIYVQMWKCSSYCHLHSQTLTNGVRIARSTIRRSTAVRGGIE